MSSFKIDVELAKSILDYNPDTGVFTWKVTRSHNAIAGNATGYVGRLGYCSLQVNKRRVLAHRLAWYFFYGEWPVADVDHINGNRSDNRICNLRLASRQQNLFNSKIRSNNSVGYKGVTRDRNRFSAYITKSGKRKYLGSFGTPEEAYEVYCLAAKEMHGEFARVA